MKLYVVTRADLTPPVQTVQVAHAVARFALTFPHYTEEWRGSGETMVILEVPDERALDALVERAIFDNVLFDSFREPDMGSAVTAAVFGHGEPGKKLCGHLPLLGA